MNEPMINRIKRLFGSLRTTHWALLVVAIFGVGLMVDAMAGGYFWRTLGGAGKVMAGGLIGFWFSRKTTRLNVSSLQTEQGRCLAGLSQAILIAAAMLGVALSV